MTLQSGQVFHWHEWNGGFAGLIGGEPVFIAQPAPDLLQCSPGMAEKARVYLGLDHDLPAIAATFPQGDAVLERAVAWCPGLRVLRQPHWECLATFITSALKQVSHIRRMSLALRERFGRPIAGPGLPLQYSYPDPAALAAAGEAALRECGLGFRASYLHRAAVDFMEGKLDFEVLSTLPDADALQSLCSLFGVGEKIASCALLFAWERHGAFPIDVWIERALRDLYFPRRRSISARAVREFAHRHFGPNRGYAQQFLFHWARMTDCGRK